MSQNLTQPEEIDHVLMEMAGHDMKEGAPDYPLGVGRVLTRHVGLKPDLQRIDFVGAAPAKEQF